MKKTSNKVVFFGNEKLATGIKDVQPVIWRAVQQAGFEIEQTVTGPIRDLKPHTAQLGVLAAYGHIIPQRILDEFPLGIINVHPSLLPRHRGPTPIEYALLTGDAKTGVSIMKLTAGMDEGPIFKQKSIAIPAEMTKFDLTKQLQDLGAALLVEVLLDITRQKAKARQQPHPDRATYSKKLTKEMSILDWSKPAYLLEREIKAFAGWPASRTNLNGIELTVTSAEADNGYESGKIQSGSIQIDKHAKTLAIITGEGRLYIQQLKPDGKRVMSTADFLAGYGQRLAAS
jgi:methionyl-tRNA formyltransferase